MNKLGRVRIMETNKTPIDEIIDDALEHYNEAADEIMHYKSIIPTALEYYREHHKFVGEEISREQDEK